MSNKALSRFHQKISVPGRRLVHHIPLAFVRKKVMGHVREIYKYVKAAKDTVPGIRPIYEQMAVYFDRPGQPDEPPANPA